MDLKLWTDSAVAICLILAAAYWGLQLSRELRQCFRKKPWPEERYGLGPEKPMTSLQRLLSILIHWEPPRGHTLDSLMVIHCAQHRALEINIRLVDAEGKPSPAVAELVVADDAFQDKPEEIAASIQAGLNETFTKAFTELAGGQDVAPIEIHYPLHGSNN